MIMIAYIAMWFIIALLCGIIINTNFIVIHKRSKYFPIFYGQIVSDEDWFTLFSAFSNSCYLVNEDDIDIIWIRKWKGVIFQEPETTVLSNK